MTAEPPVTPPDRKPLLVVADDDPAERGRVTDELERRYGADYAVSGCTNDELTTILDEASRNGHEVAVVLAAGERGAELLARVRALHPAARRGLLIPWLGWLDRPLAELVLKSMARGWIDLYVLRPTTSPDEVFHRTIAELLQESARLRGEGPAGATIVAEPRSTRAHALRATISGLGIPHRLEAQADATEPSVTLADGSVLADPSAAELTRALGFPTELEPHEADLVVVGAGPAGLSAAGLRLLGGPAHDRARRRGGRRPGRIELADPQLPRFPARARRRRARPARVSAGLALRHPLPADRARRRSRDARATESRSAPPTASR